MGKEKKPVIKFMADTETYTQDNCEKVRNDHGDVYLKTGVWAAVCCEIRPIEEAEKTVVIYESVMEMFDHIRKVCESRHANALVYFHNLAFDGKFIISILKGLVGYTDQTGKIDRFKMRSKDYMYTISDSGQWYQIILKMGKTTIEIRDSLKLISAPVSRIGKDWHCKYRKLEMDYEHKRGSKITEEEAAYIRNDVLVVAEALYKMSEMFGELGLTIGSICWKLYKSYYSKEEWKVYFPNLYEVECRDKTLKNVTCLEDYIRLSYHGGWCYVDPRTAQTELHNGIVLDVNSLYPSMMLSDSGNRYPIGLPIAYYDGELPEDVKTNDDLYYFVHIKCNFRIKPGNLPTIQIKNDGFYNGREWLTSSYFPCEDGTDTEYYYWPTEGKTMKHTCDLVMTKTDFELFCEQYDLYDMEIISCYVFQTKIGIFDEYINKYAEMKKVSKGSVRQCCKLLLNNIYGKFAMTNDNTGKLIERDDETGCLMYAPMTGEDRKPGYIPIGSAITAYARRFTIKAAQANYEHFAYSDTDSIHLYDMKKEDAKGVVIHPVNLNAWDCEGEWDIGFFTRQKTYIEYAEEDKIKEEEYVKNLEMEKPFGWQQDAKERSFGYNIKCAGMGKNARKNLLSMFLSGEKSIKDFVPGLVVPGNLKAREISGGVILMDSDYRMS